MADQIHETEKPFYAKTKNNSAKGPFPPYSLVKYVMQVQKLSMKTNFSPDCIIAMDEIVVWSDMVGNVTVDTTETKDVPLKSTGNDKVKVSIYLTAKTDGTKLKRC